MKGQTSPQYAPHLWHDNPIYSLRLLIGDTEAGDWRSELVLDIDHIVGWECDRDGRAVLRVAPATLTFHDAADLRVAVDCGDSGGQIALHEWSIGQVTREPIPDRKVCLDRPFYRWRIELNWPTGGLIGFAASGFSQVLRADPILTNGARLPLGSRL